MSQHERVETGTTQSTVNAQPPSGGRTAGNALAIASAILTILGTSVYGIYQFLFVRSALAEPLAIASRIDMPAIAVFTLDASNQHQWNLIRRTLDISYELDTLEFRRRKSAGETATEPSDFRSFKRSLIAFGLPARVIIGFHPLGRNSSGDPKLAEFLAITCTSRGINAVRMFLSPTHHSTVLPDLPQAELYLPADPSHSIVGVARNCVVLGETQSVVRDGLRAVAQAATGEGKVTPIPPPFFRQQADLPDMMLTVRNTDLFRKFENKPFLVQLFSDCPKSAFCSDSAFAAVVTASQSLLDHCERIDLLGTMADGGKRFLGRLECAAKQNRKQARDALLGATGAFDASYLESKNCLSTDATCIFYAIDHPVRLLFWQALR